MANKPTEKTQVPTPPLAHATLLEGHVTPLATQEPSNPSIQSYSANLKSLDPYNSLPPIN